MTFKEQFDIAKQNKLDNLDIYIYETVFNSFAHYNDDEIEVICRKVRNIFLHSEYFSVQSIVDGLCSFDGNPLTVDYWDEKLLNEICYYTY